VLAQAGIVGGELDTELEERCAKHGEGVPEGEWSSLTPELVKSLYPLPRPKR
jgi:hypothetical protein